MPEIVLRDYQVADIHRLRQSYAAGSKAPIYQLSTGGGKTVVFSHVIRGAVAKGNRVLVLAHRRELIKQASAKLDDLEVEHGIIAAGMDRDHDAQVIVASIQTVARRMDSLPQFDLIVIDEAHHAVAKTWSKLLAAQASAKLLGVTATPARLDGKGLGKHCGGHFDHIVCGPPMQELVDAGHLAPCKVFVPAARIDVTGLRTIAGDYDEGELEKRAAGVTGDAVTEFTKLPKGTTALVFCVTVKHAKTVADAFIEAGYVAATVNGDMDKEERDAAIAGLGDGSIEVLTSCEVISEGLDVPSVGCVILLRPTQSLTMMLQQIGRGMRPKADGGPLIVFDHAGNCIQHGLPTEKREWTLDGCDEQEDRKPPEPWMCIGHYHDRLDPTKHCGYLNTPARPQCVECEAPKPWKCVIPWSSKGRPKGQMCGELNYPESEMCRACGKARPRRHIPVQDKAVMKEFIPVDHAHVLRMNYYQFIARPRSEAEVTAYARHRGYKKGWVWHFMKEQTQRFADARP
jgi:DNA repair protein RadD